MFEANMNFNIYAINKKVDIILCALVRTYM